MCENGVSNRYTVNEHVIDNVQPAMRGLAVLLALVLVHCVDALTVRWTAQGVLPEAVGTPACGASEGYPLYMHRGVTRIIYTSTTGFEILLYSDGPESVSDGGALLVTPYVGQTFCPMYQRSGAPVVCLVGPGTDEVCADPGFPRTRYDTNLPAFPARYDFMSATIAADPDSFVRNALLIYGGHNTTGGLHDDMWLVSAIGPDLCPMNTGMYVRLLKRTPWQGPRIYAGLASFDNSNRVIFTGGLGKLGHYRNDVWYASDVTSGRWARQTDYAPWKRRAGHSIWTVDSLVVIYGGGRTHTTRFNDVWISGDLGREWKRLILVNTPKLSYMGCALTVMINSSYATLYALGSGPRALSNLSASTSIARMELDLS